MLVVLARRPVGHSSLRDQLPGEQRCILPQEAGRGGREGEGRLYQFLGRNMVKTRPYRDCTTEIITSLHALSSGLDWGIDEFKTRGEEC